MGRGVQGLLWTRVRCGEGVVKDVNGSDGDQTVMYDII